jgi:hypothetical protein
MTPKPKAAPTRLYLVALKDADGADTESPAALIEASNPAQASRHFLDKRYTVRHASQRDIIAATKADIEPETAVEAD